MPERRAEGHERVGDDDDEVADVLVVHQRVDDEGEQREQEVVGELEPEEDPRVQPELEIVVAQDASG